MSTYDLVGDNPRFLEEDVRFRIYKSSQVLHFNEPVHSDSIEVVWWHDDDNSTSEVVRGVEWAVAPDGHDEDAMSEALLMDHNFAGTLVNSIIILTPIPSDRTYIIRYQKFMLSAMEEGYYSNDGPQPTSGLLREMIEDIDFLKNIKNPLHNITSEVAEMIRVLEEDITGDLAANIITDELHDVNVPAGQMVLRLAAGAFYEHDLVLRLVSTGVILTRGVDYEVIGLNRPKTKVAQHPSGVYDYIMLTKPFVGQIKVESYRAFGGEVTPKDINSIKDVLADVVRMISEGIFLTEQTLPFTPQVMDMMRRLGIVEDAVMHYNQANHRIVATSSGRHWYTIADLYTDAWSNNILTASHIHIGLKSTTQGWVYETHLSVNLKRIYEKMRVDVVSSVNRENTFALSKYEDVGNELIPMLRMLWNQDPATGEMSGAVLQVGMVMVENRVETLSVYDKSGTATDIHVKANIAGTDAVQDDNVLLPNGCTWVAGEEKSLESLTPLCPEEGYLVWGGAMPVTMLDNGNFIEHSFYDDEFRLSNIKQITMYFYDRINDEYIKSTNHHRWDDVNITSESILYFKEDLCAIKYEFGGGSGEPITLRLTSSTGTNSILNNRFDLLQIVAHT